jgi:NAD+ synthetase
LKPGQVDSEALPDYPVLDTLLKDLFEGGMENDLESLYEIHDKEMVDQVLRKVRIAEWKRRQTALGPKVSSYSFSSSRNMPITMKK